MEGEKGEGGWLEKGRRGVAEQGNLTLIPCWRIKKTKKEGINKLGLKQPLNRHYRNKLV